MVSVATRPSAVLRRVPKDLLDADGGVSPRFTHFCRCSSASDCGYIWVFFLELSPLGLFCFKHGGFAPSGYGYP